MVVYVGKYWAEGLVGKSQNFIFDDLCGRHCYTDPKNGQSTYVFLDELPKRRLRLSLRNLGAELEGSRSVLSSKYVNHTIHE